MNDETLFLRQVHPSFADNGEVSSQAFYPFPKDKGKLSVDNGDLVSPEGAFKHFTETLHFSSIGTWGVSCAEVGSTGLPYGPDALEDNTAHCYIDFEDRSEKECRKLAKKLKAAAHARGCLYKAA